MFTIKLIIIIIIINNQQLDQKNFTINRQIRRTLMINVRRICPLIVKLGNTDGRQKLNNYK